MAPNLKSDKCLDRPLAHGVSVAWVPSKGETKVPDEAESLPSTLPRLPTLIGGSVCPPGQTSEDWQTALLTVGPCCTCFARGSSPCEGLDADVTSAMVYVTDEALDSMVELPANSLRAKMELVYKDNVSLGDGSTYSGQFRGGDPHGHGVLLKADGSKYSGVFHNGSAHGHGRLEESGQKCFYEGQWAMDHVHGVGRHESGSGSAYEGEWISDTKHGNGTETWADGSAYKGQFFTGMKRGSGVFYKPGGEVLYSGEFLDDQMHGEGTYNFPDGCKYVGEWHRGQVHGKGSMKWPDGVHYRGQFRKNERHGDGMITYADGAVYEGQWSMGKQHGEGTWTTPDGMTVTDQWAEGRRAAGSSDK